MKVHILDTIKLFLLVKYWIKKNSIKNQKYKFNHPQILNQVIIDSSAELLLLL